MVKSKENERTKLSNKVENLVDAISECTEKKTRKVLQTKIAECSVKQESLESEIKSLKEELKNKSSQVIDAKAAFELLKSFRKGFDSQPVATQVRVIKDIVRRVVIHEDHVVLEIYGAASTAPFKMQAQKHPTGDQPVGCSYRIQSGRGDWI